MSRLTALVPGAVCAAALGRGWPDDVDEQIRCLDEGSRSLGLAWCCAPGPDETRDPDTVTAGLVGTPGALRILGVVRGPLSASHATKAVGGRDDDLQDRLDDASDSAVDGIRALSSCGVSRAAVVEDVAGAGVSEDALAESHRPLLNAAAHLRVELVLVASGLDAAEPLGYERWVSPRGCSPGLGFLPREAFVSELGLRHLIARSMTLPGRDEMITAPLEDRVSPHLVRLAAGRLAGPGPEATL